MEPCSRLITETSCAGDRNIRPSNYDPSTTDLPNVVFLLHEGATFHVKQMSLFHLSTRVLSPHVLFAFVTLLWPPVVGPIDGDLELIVVQLSQMKMSYGTVDDPFHVFFSARGDASPSFS